MAQHDNNYILNQYYAQTGGSITGRTLSNTGVSVELTVNPPPNESIWNLKGGLYSPGRSTGGMSTPSQFQTPCYYQQPTVYYQQPAVYYQQPRPAAIIITPVSTCIAYAPTFGNVGWF